MLVVAPPSRASLWLREGDRGLRRELAQVVGTALALLYQEPAALSTLARAHLTTGTVWILDVFFCLLVRIPWHAVPEGCLRSSP